MNRFQAFTKRGYRWGLLILAFSLAPWAGLLASGQPMTRDGTFWLRSHRSEVDARNRDLMKAGKVLPRQPGVNGRVAADMVPGTTSASFQCYSFASGMYESRVATLQAVGAHCYIFLADDSRSLLGSDTTTAINQVKDTFDQKIYEMEKDWFGSLILPDFGLPDDKVYILLLDIRDSLGGGYVAGFFDSRDLEGQFGNQKPMFFMDLNPGKIGDVADKNNDFFRTLAHEFQHMINFSHHLPQNGRFQEERWLDEGLSQLAEYQYTKRVTGDGIGLPPSPHLSKFLADPSIVLTSNSEYEWFNGDTLFRHYGASFLFMYYVAESLGGSDETSQKTLIRAVVDNPNTGSAGLNKVFAAYGTSFIEILKNWMVANHLNDTTLNNGKWGYVNKSSRLGTEADGLPISGSVHSFSGTGISSLSGQGRVPSNAGISYADVSGSGKLTLRVQGTTAGLTPFLAVVPKSGAAYLQDIPLDSTGVGELTIDFSSVQKVVLVPAALTETSDVATQYPFSFSSSGGGVTLYPLPNPVVPNQFYIVLKSQAGSLADNPVVSVSRGGQQSSLTLAPTDSSRQVFVGHYQISGSGAGAISVSVSGGSFAAAVAGSNVQKENAR